MKLRLADQPYRYCAPAAKIAKVAFWFVVTLLAICVILIVFTAIVHARQ
jgi:hypothetical protein